SHPMTEGTNGRGNVQLLNEAGYDAVTIGNNEGITLSKAGLEHLYDGAEFSVIVANLFDADGNRPVAMEPYKLFKLTNGITVAVIGITIPFTAFYESLGWKTTDPEPILQELIPVVRNRADIV